MHYSLALFENDIVKTIKEFLSRGKIDVKDIAFNPTVQEGANFYTKSWNYCTWYEDEGHVIEGQRTF